MRVRFVSLFLLLLLPLPAFAAMSAEEFEAYVTGQTLTYSHQGRVYGIEEYLPGRRVRWSFVGDECRDGIWYPQGEEICFLYDDRPTDPQCWVFTRKDGRLSALFTGATDGRELYEAQRSTEPMICLGPDVGV